jgi:hypothetical protein
MTICLIATWLSMSAAEARPAEGGARTVVTATPYVTTQQGMTLSQAIEQVRRQANVERIIKAETRTSGGCEVHHIRVQTKDGKVRTHEVRGRCR